ncbi:polyamine ABC transporter ATP-binding protein [Halobiforma lacisalsi AJ5]|uniref:Molybdate/tungstate import ATP-binding protein WtpC n=1 Tax=Natronobacterium lacisalsi AJ5 TaxID=358396 RepID=M0L3K3_NATLA|nr:ABC transporter ATP-binding protein [Halobiforma lacisalsi]APW98145.1 polyamine ABC transporter ATP-binding protein [Halobiforma lacisalsi AJ5]EMA28126.1 spermidine/putrescine ABC transporter ATPase [Halobiforma lacisalsi AJ5]
MSAITLDGVRKRYPGGVLAVKGVDIDIESGEFVTLVGPSGCGKTTTLRTIAGFERPTDGTVSIADEEVTDLPPYERDTGMVFQDFALFPHMTIHENVAYGMEADGGYTDEEIDARVAEMLELVELPEMGDRTPDQLSGGQQQRVALARALAPKPQALLLDEPLASLDKKLREQMQVELRRIQQEVGITTVFVTHNQEEALTMSDRIAVMNDGRFEQVGPPGEVYDEPKTRFVADFLGTANIFDGSVRAVENGRATVECDDVTLRTRATSGVKTGDDVSVVIRPERFELSTATTDGGTTAEADGADLNVFEGEITFRRHLGSSIEYHLETLEGRELVVVRRSGHDERTAGERVSVRVEADDCRIVEA